MEQFLMTGKFDFLDFFLMLFIGNKGWYSILTAILSYVGFWKMFEKSGLKGWMALVPCLREYQMGRCAGREPEGRVYAVCTFLARMIAVLGVAPALLLTRSMDQNTALVLIDIFTVSLGIMTIVYMIRIYSGLIEVYGVKKRWMWLWILAEWLVSLLWGFKDKYQPAWKVEDM